MFAGAGLLGLLSLKLLASTLYPDHLPAAQRTWPEAEPEGVTHHRETLADAWRIDEEALPALGMPLPCSLEDTPAAPAGDPSHVPALTEVMESLLAEHRPVKALKALATSLAGDQLTGLPLATVERMVSSFRASRHWREPDATRDFLQAMIESFDRLCMSDAHLEQLLKVWDWAYGDVSGQLVDEGSDVGWTLTNSIVGQLARHLEGPAMSDSQQTILIRAVCREPTGDPTSSGDGRVMTAHASRVGEALAELFIQLTTVRHPWPDIGSWVEGRLLTFLHYPLTQPCTDARWKPAIFNALQDQGTNPRIAALIPEERWRAGLLNAVNRYLLLFLDGKQLQRYPSFGEALAALHVQSLIIIRDPSKDPWTQTKKITQPDDIQRRIAAIEVPITTKIEQTQADFGAREGPTRLLSGESGLETAPGTAPAPRPGQAPAATALEASTPLAPQTLSEALEKILHESDPQTKLSALATQLAGGRKGMLPVVVVDRMVDAYRASYLWRKPDPMRNFLSAMVDALNKGGMNIEHLEHLLRIWSWRYGELHDQAGKEIDLEKYVRPAWIVRALTSGLGGPSISDRDLRLLLASITQEPDNIRPAGLNSGPGSDGILSDHARRVSDAVSELMVEITPPTVSGASAEKSAIGPTQLVRCVRIFLQQPAGDRRWHTLVLSHLEVWAPRTAKGEVLPAAEWKRLILQALQEHLAETAPDLVPARTFGEAIMALFNPKERRSGQKFDIKFIPR